VRKSEEKGATLFFRKECERGIYLLLRRGKAYYLKNGSPGGGGGSTLWGRKALGIGGKGRQINPKVSRKKRLRPKTAVGPQWQGAMAGGSEPNPEWREKGKKFPEKRHLVKRGP